MGSNQFHFAPGPANYAASTGRGMNGECPWGLGSLGWGNSPGSPMYPRNTGSYCQNFPRDIPQWGVGGALALTLTEGK